MPANTRALALRPVYGLNLGLVGELLVKLSKQIKPISYLKAHTAEIVRTLGETQEPLIITQNGEAKVVIQDIDSYEEMQNTMALLKILALGNRQIEARETQPASNVIARIRERSRGARGT